MLNLLVNAVKFTLKGEIIVRAEMVGDAKKIKISVIDTGIGVPE